MGTQQSIFDELYENYKIKRPIRLIELFAGDSIVVNVLMAIIGKLL